MDLAARCALVVAVLVTGLMAGLYFAFSIAVMPGLARASDRSLVEGMNGVNAAILNGPFALAFGGALAFGVVALALHLPGRVRTASPGVLPWLLAGVVLYAVTLAVTFAVNVPLNDALAAAGPAGGADPAAARAAFEGRWLSANHWRTLAAAASFACELIALAR